MSTKNAITFAFCFCFLGLLTAQTSLSSGLEELKKGNARCFTIPLGWIETIDTNDTGNLTVSFISQREDSIRKVVDNYDYILIENAEVYAVILPYYSSLQGSFPTIYMGGSSPDCYSFPVQINISHLPIIEQKRYKKEIKRVKKMLKVK
jgi:hypothetical protein